MTGKSQAVPTNHLVIEMNYQGYCCYTVQSLRSYEYSGVHYSTLLTYSCLYMYAYVGILLHNAEFLSIQVVHLIYVVVG